GRADGAWGHPGLRVDQTTLYDDSLEPRVRGVGDDCDALKTDTADDRNECAASYVGERMAAMRRQGNLPGGRVLYGNIPQVKTDPKNQFFRRGFSRPDKISMGPSGPESNVDFQNYAAHEVGHQCGRGHPGTGLGCGHSPDDPGYPYAHALIDTKISEF